MRAGDKKVVEQEDGRRSLEMIGVGGPNKAYNHQSVRDFPDKPFSPSSCVRI